MAFPSRKAQIQEIAKFLDADHTEGRELAEIAADIVDAFADMYGKEFKDPPLTPHIGMAFKHPALSGVWHVGYEYQGSAWMISATTKIGGFIPTDSPFWSYATPSTAKSGAPGNNPAWQVSDRVSRRQRQFVYDIVATGDKCVLLQDRASHTLSAESNENMDRYYQRESSQDADW